jgi:hypothetical protein
MSRKLRLTKIEKIERRPLTEAVYNLAVAEDESYVADDVVVHNCRSIWAPITLDIAPAAEDYINPEDLAEASRLADGRFGGSYRNNQANRP